MSFDAGLTRSNLDCFLHCTTPTVKSQFLPKSEIRNLNLLWNFREIENVVYFTLSDLWSCYDEWSAYGAGVPIMLNSYETLVQYYVPYLSAVQIFTSSSPVNSLREETDSFSDSSSDESVTEKLWRWDGCSSEDGSPEQDSRLGYLYFQYFERSTPYGRVPLMDKINGLSGRFSDMDPGDDIEGAGDGAISLPAFGLATYKMQGDVWVSGNSGRDGEKLVSLLSVADSWLKQLGVQHHDFDYFRGIRHG
ncbi:(RS)-norcoclaurine 6-O-methyltransferase-like isoform 1 [Hibiscus syriacus]|uniref:(RS)-norcoclaurine 6-O-methyltransferase-like isoform 1 n=1 Tax=Hibiscus syriacus TaxID=106335 RepID=A0A6A3DAU7_HIBSY|nr:(RS)-norcoclaurine 6-O-methyltransferase-like isoform 1 [Hibiscus syriacus]